MINELFDLFNDNGINIVVILFTIFLFFILREFFCWYWKINAMKDLMEEQRDLLKKIVDKENISLKNFEEDK